MKNTNKFIVLDENIYKSLVENKIPQNINPAVSQLLTLENKLQNVLGNKQLNSDQKFFEYHQLFQNYKNSLEEAQKPIKVVVESSAGPLKEVSKDGNIEKETHSTTTEDLPGLAPSFKNILSAVKSEKAENFVEVLNSKNIAWNSKGAVMSDGKPIPGSDIRTIVGFFVSDRKDEPPPPGALYVAQLLGSVQKNVVGLRGQKYLHQLKSKKIASTPKSIRKENVLTSTPFEDERETTAASSFYSATNTPTTSRLSSQSTPQSTPRLTPRSTPRIAGSRRPVRKNRTQRGTGLFKINLWKK